MTTEQIIEGIEAQIAAAELEIAASKAYLSDVRELNRARLELEANKRARAHGALFRDATIRELEERIKSYEKIVGVRE